MGIRVRGIGTSSQNNANALIVIDGVPNTNSNALTMMNPRDVESITVLKDAASTALWGSRGANGVVMVTTKKGQQGKAKVTFDAKWGINMIGSNGKPDLLRDPADYYENDLGGHLQLGSLRKQEKLPDQLSESEHEPRRGGPVRQPAPVQLHG
ncbi:MAG: TonB-dependent receptor plug domain-containing protein [Alistipes indistinctus]